MAKRTTQRPRHRAIKSEGELNDVIKSTAKGTVSALSHETYNVLREFIISGVYESKEPKSYERTYDFLNSITITRKKTYSGKIEQGEISFDWKKLRRIKSGPNTWGTHVGVSGQDMRKALVDILNDGVNGGLYERDGANFIENTIDWLNDNLDNTVANISTKTQYMTGDDADGAKVASGIRIRKRK